MLLGLIFALPVADAIPTGPPPLPDATAPPLQYLWPTNREQVPVDADVNPYPYEVGAVYFGCPRWLIQGGKEGTIGDYSVGFSTGPELNAEGELTTHMAFAHEASPEAGRDVCAAGIPSLYASTPGTYYWQVKRTNCFAPECSQSMGPVSQFEVVDAMSFEPVDNSHGFGACQAAGRVKARGEHSVIQLKADLSKNPSRRGRRHIRAELTRVVGALEEAKHRVHEVC